MDFETSILERSHAPAAEKDIIFAMDFSTELTEYRRRIKYHIQKVIGIKPSRFKLKLIDAAFEKGGISSFAGLGGSVGGTRRIHILPFIQERHFTGVSC